MIKVFRLITSIRFYAGMICMILLMLFFSQTDVLSFRWVPSLSVSTSLKTSDGVYFSQKKVSDYAVLLTYANISVGHSSYSPKTGAGLSDLQGDIITKSLTTTKNLNTIRTTDILQVSTSDDKVDGIGLHLQQAQIILSQSQTLIQPLTQLIEEDQAKIDACTSEKSQADELYVRGLQTQNSVQVTQATLDAQQASTCIASSTVSLNSKTGVLKNLITEITKTQQYVDIVTRNKTLIGQYDSILDGTIPSELVKIQQELSTL